MINLKNIQTEVDASFLYAVLAEREKDEVIASIYKEMSDIECSHAIAFLEKNGMSKSQYPQPSFRAKLIKTLGGWFGTDFILGILLNTEKSLASSIQSARSQTRTSASLSDTAHVVILKNIIKKNNVEGTNLAQFEKRHRSVGGNALRAAVLGGNDGLVSNFSLVMGIAGATNGQKEVLLAGMAGLLAGALSMALGEWISVKSSQELYENQMQLEMDELEHNPEGEERELALIYMSKGIDTTKAKQMANEVMKDKNQAHEVLVREELGINSEELKGSAMEAALASFFFFAIGALLPVIPFFFMSGLDATLTSAGLSALGLFLIGAIITLFTGKSMLYSGMRQVIFGLAAAAITYSIGKWIGVSLI